MKISGDDLKGALKQRKRAAGESSQPAKKARDGGRAMPVPSTGAPMDPAVTEEPPKEVPAEEAAPGPAGAATEGGEKTTTTEAMVVVVDLEEGELAARGVPETGRAEPIVNPPAEGEVTKEAPPAAGAKKTPATGSSGATKPRAETRKPAEKRKEPEGPIRQQAPIPTRPRADGPQTTRVRPVPAIEAMGDAQDASILLSQICTPEVAAEMRKLPPSGILDMLMVAFIQAANGVMGIREAMGRFSNNLSKANDRAEKYKKECAAQSQGLTRLRDESRAKEERLQKQITEGEQRSREAAARISALEMERDQATLRLKTLRTRAEEQGRQLQEAQRLVAEAQNEARAAAGKAAEALAEKAGAVACADEASVRAGEAENKAWEAETRAKEAEAKALKAVEEYKSSPDFKKEVIEGSLDAYVKGFDACKAKVSEVLKISDSDLEKVQLAESDDEQEEGGGGDGAGAGEP